MSLPSERTCETSRAKKTGLAFSPAQSTLVPPHNRFTSSLPARSALTMGSGSLTNGAVQDASVKAMLVARDTRWPGLT